MICTYTFPNAVCLDEMMAGDDMKPHIEPEAVMHARITAVEFLAVFVLLLTATPIAVAQSEEEFHQQVSLLSGGSVVVENGRGDVSIEGWDKAEMQVDARKIFDGDGAVREHWMRETKVRVEGDEHHRLVKVEYPSDLLHSWGFWSGERSVSLKIHLPRQVDAELKTDRGHVTVQQITGKLDIGSDRGEVDITRLDGELRVHADRGHLKVRDSAIRGGIRVSLDRGSADIALQHLAGDSNLEVSRGDLSVTLPKSASFTVDAERTRRSAFRTDFSVLVRGNFGGSIRGEVNGGGPVLRLRGERGDVWLHAGSQPQ